MTAKSIVEIVPTPITKLDFEGVDAVHSALCFAFMPNGLGEEDILDDKFLALWTLFLVSAGWSEDEYWEEYENHPSFCQDCGEELDEEGRHLDDDDQLELPLPNKNIAAENKPN